MTENDIKLHTDYLITAIESSEDIKTVEETVNEIREYSRNLNQFSLTWLVAWSLIKKILCTENTVVSQ